MYSVQGQAEASRWTRVVPGRCICFSVLFLACDLRCADAFDTGVIYMSCKTGFSSCFKSTGVVWDVVVIDSPSPFFNHCVPSGHGHGHELVAGVVESRVHVLMPLKTCHVEWLMHVKSAVAQCPHIGTVWKLGDWFASSGVVLAS
ncbi:hypothetical protein TNCV_1144761 [Trichonephila clavipes]|nr:hypothetical protein TNCV_1144761 [Trichonephila clavipes]